MPEISRFNGMIIRMFIGDHPLPHFHVKYNDCMAKIAISDGSIIAGKLPNNQLESLKKWITLNKDELNKNWELCTSKRTPNKIKPLE